MNSPVEKWVPESTDFCQEPDSAPIDGEERLMLLQVDLRCGSQAGEGSKNVPGTSPIAQSE
jgi:hypothetical protein